MENIKDTPEVEQKPTSSQEEIDNAVASAKARWNKKLEKDYVPVEQFNELQAQLTQAQHELKLPKLQEQFVKAGGKKEAFNDFMKLNSNLFDAKDEKEVATILEQAKKAQAYMFNAQTFNATVGDNTTNGKVDYSNGSLLRTK